MRRRFGRREHCPAMRMEEHLTKTSGRQGLELLLCQRLGHPFLCQAANQGGGLACPRRPEENESSVKRQSKDLALVTIKDWLIAQGDPFDHLAFQLLSRRRRVLRHTGLARMSHGVSFESKNL